MYLLDDEAIGDVDVDGGHEERERQTEASVVQPVRLDVM